MADGEYWFARRFPVGNPRNAMSPINEQGYAVVRKFITWMVGSAVVAAIVSIALALWAPVPFLWIAGVLIFPVVAAYAGYAFIAAAQGRGDHQHTVEDYKAGRVK
jgi:hypothetical protein